MDKQLCSSLPLRWFPNTIQDDKKMKIFTTGKLSTGIYSAWYIPLECILDFCTNISCKLKHDVTICPRDRWMRVLIRNNSLRKVYVMKWWMTGIYSRFSEKAGRKWLIYDKDCMALMGYWQIDYFYWEFRIRLNLEVGLYALCKWWIHCKEEKKKRKPNVSPVKTHYQGIDTGLILINSRQLLWALLRCHA